MDCSTIESLAFLLIPLLLHAAASAIDATFPRPVEGSPWLLLRNFIGVLALAVGKAKNPPPEPPK